MELDKMPAPQSSSFKREEEEEKEEEQEGQEEEEKCEKRKGDHSRAKRVIGQAKSQSVLVSLARNSTTADKVSSLLSSPDRALISLSTIP